MLSTDCDREQDTVRSILGNCEKWGASVSQ